MKEEKIEDINMKEIVDKVKNDIESYMMEDMEHQNKEIEYILYNANTKETQVIASDKIEEMILFAPFTKEQQNEYINIPEWDFNFDEYLFKELQNGYEIAYMSNDTHYGIWISIDELYPEEFEYKDGVIKYFKYCKDNNITKKYLDNEVKMNVPDIMKFYEYPIGIIEQQGNNIIMSKNNFEKENEKSYIAFVLGYDLLNNKLQNSISPECDSSYDICSSFAEQFINSKEYKNVKYSTYEMLQEWLNKNPELVNSYLELDNQENKTRKLDNGIIVIDLGYRREQPIALVRRGDGDNMEYVVAFNYRIKDNKMDWAYGYYYNKNLSKATEDFRKVIAGGNLDKTFEKKQNKKRNERSR